MEIIQTSKALKTASGEKSTKLRIGKRKGVRPLTALPKDSKEKKLSIVQNLTSSNFFPQKKDETKKKTAKAKRMYLMSAGRERSSTGFVHLGSKMEKERGLKHEENLSKSIQNLRMRSTYSSGFGVSTPSFMVSNRKVHCTKLRKYSPPLKYATHKRHDTNRTRISNSLVVFEDPELASKNSNEKDVQIIHIDTNMDNTFEENKELESIGEEVKVSSKSPSSLTRMKTISPNFNSVDELRPQSFKLCSKVTSKEQNMRYPTLTQEISVPTKL